MVLKIHHVPLARSTRPIWLYFELLELYESGKLPELEIIYVDMNTFRTEKSPEFLAKNPNGKVPLLVKTKTFSFTVFATMLLIYTKLKSLGMMNEISKISCVSIKPNLKQSDKKQGN